MSCVIDVKDLSFKYEDDVILENINFSINKGEFVLFSGPSGQGKSTLIYLLCGIIPHIIYGKAKGEILVNGENILDKKVAEISKEIGITLQNAENQIIQKYVEDELAFGAENIGLKKEQIKKQLETISKIFKLNLKDECRTLSGGQKQKLITGSTLMMGQKIIVLDEPLANLDKTSSIELIKILKGLTKAGFTILIAEHRLDFLMSSADRVFKVSNKKCVEIHDFLTFIKDELNQISVKKREKPCKNLLFSLKNVSFKVGKQSILNDINLDIYAGEKVLLLGENGAGKTTLIRILARLNKIKEGEFKTFVIYKNKTIKRANKHWFKKVGVVYQNPNYQLFMKTVFDEINFQAYSPEYRDYIISLFNLENLLTRHPQSLSEGQKRKVTIAAILAMKPEVLLLDEPTVGQDFDSLKNLIEILEKIHKETNNTMISITHDARCANALCDKSVYIKDKTISEIGSEELVNKFFNLYN